MNFHLIWGKDLSKSSQKALGLTNLEKLLLRSNVISIGTCSARKMQFYLLFGWDVL